MSHEQLRRRKSIPDDGNIIHQFRSYRQRHQKIHLEKKQGDEKVMGRKT